tara:strand:- start:47 stop:1303 length:1257 start_codon:yes stop_codon:yes gene_type:complete
MKTKTIRKSKYTNGGMKFYKSGGMRYMNGGLPQYRARRKFEAGGSMYADNTVQAAGQGGAGTTSNIVFQESNPELQLQREQALIDQNKQSVKDAAMIEEEIAAEDQQSVVDIKNTATSDEAKSQTLVSGIKTGSELIGNSMRGEPEIDPATGEPKTDELGNVITTSKVSDFDSSLIRSGKNLYKGQGVTSAAPRGTVSIVNKTTGEGMSLMPGAEIPAGFEATGVSGGSGVSTALSKASSGIKAFGAQHAGSAVGKAGTWMGKGLVGGGSTLAQMANPAMIATLAGMGVKKLSDDDDATTFNVGEASGSVLSGIGTGAGIGNMIIPGIGAVVGAGIGGLTAGIGGLVKRNKARTLEREYEAKKKIKVDKYNKELMTNFGSQKSRVNAGNLAQKTYSGYDLGQNVVAKRGGYRNMPQYI